MYNVLGCKTAAAIHDGSPYAEALARLFAKNFAETWGGTVTSVEAIDPQAVDMRPVLNRIAADKPCLIYFPVFVAAAAQIVRQAQDVSALSDTQMIAGSAVMSKDFISAAGTQIVGLRFTYPDISSETYDMTRYPNFVKEYHEMFGEDPIQGFHTWAYDGANLAYDAIEKVAVTDENGNTYIGRKALRDALFATKGVSGLSGEISCNEHGDCKKFVFSAYQFTSSDEDTFEPGTNPQKIYSDAWTDEKKAEGVKAMNEMMEKLKKM
jgi:branched-chain amino acid transport system substrate-binding protein